jgi:hypothetical protein
MSIVRLGIMPRRRRSWWDRSQAGRAGEIRARGFAFPPAHACALFGRGSADEVACDVCEMSEPSVTMPAAQPAHSSGRRLRWRVE